MTTPLQRLFPVIALLVALCFFCTTAGGDPPKTLNANVADLMAVAGTKLAAHDAAHATKTAYPDNSGGSTWNTKSASGNFTQGFYPGSLWYQYQWTGQDIWKTRAEAWTSGLENLSADSHDIGFKTTTSFGNGYRLTANADYKDEILTSANRLSERYNTTVGCTRSWGNVTDTGDFEVIIDNMMNLELLFSAHQNGGSSTHHPTISYYDMAVSHADKTIAEHIRADGGTYQVVDFDQSDGTADSKYTVQGKGDETTWSRGQAWGLYGFTMTYRYTNEARFLNTAKTLADYFVDNLPDDFVPQADFDSTYTDLAHKDSSAAAIAAAGLVELSTLVTDQTEKQKYWDAAVDILNSLSSSPYFSDSADDASLLLHGSRKYPGDDWSYIWGDYYFIEALARYDAAVPEPATLALMGLGGIGVLLRRRRK